MVAEATFVCRACGKEKPVSQMDEYEFVLQPNKKICTPCFTRGINALMTDVLDGEDDAE